MSKIDQIKGALVVSCQALDHEPLHSSFIMGRMARAVAEGGANGIRANSVEDITEIKKNTDLPIIGIIKKNYPNSNVYITPTMQEVDELVKVGVDIIAMHATDEERPGGIGLEEFFAQVKKKYPQQLFMADCSTIEEVLTAERLGFDFLGTTLVGYTEQSKGVRIEENDFELIRELLKKTQKPIIAEGNIDSPQKARRVLELGCYSVVVGSSITRPQLITKKYVNAIEEQENK